MPGGARPAFKLTTHESPTADRPAPLSVCVDIPDLLSLFVVSGHCNDQLRWRLALAGKRLSHTGAVQRNEVENAERSDALAGEL